MAPHEDGRGPNPPERVPLLMGGSLVQHVNTMSADTQSANRAASSGSFKGEGHSLLKPGGINGLIADADDVEEADHCCGHEQTIYSILARLPAVHTIGVLSVWFYFGRVWLLLQAPEVAVAVVTILMVYGIFRFWLMWGSCFHSMHLIRRSDSREASFWPSKKRPPGTDFFSVWHAVMVPNYKEPIEKLRQTLDTIASQTIAHQVVVVMAMESRDPKATETATQLQLEYGNRLGGFCYALHPLAEGEVAGKSSNENYAARCIAQTMVKEMRINPDNIILTTCDADTYFHPNHFACLSHHFLCDGDNRHHRFYLPVTNFMPNINVVPGVCSARYTALSIGRMAELGDPIKNPFPLAIYSVPLKLAMTAKYWDPSVIPEDWHMYFRCVFADHGRVQCTKMMVMVGTEAVEGKDYFDTIKECYQQSVRWQWGAIDLGYLLVQAAVRWDVPLWKRLQLLHTAYDHHLFVVVMSIALISAPFLYGHIPVMLDLNLITGQQVVLQLKDLMLYTWLVHFFCHVIFMSYAEAEVRQVLLRDRLHFDFSGSHMKFPWRQLQLLWFPIGDFALFVIPTIHAHMRMFWSSSFNYVPSAKLGGKPKCPTAPTDCCGGRDSTV